MVYQLVDIRETKTSKNSNTSTSLSYLFRSTFTRREVDLLIPPAISSFLRESIRKKTRTDYSRFSVDEKSSENRLRFNSPIVDDRLLLFLGVSNLHVSDQYAVDGCRFVVEEYFHLQRSAWRHVQFSGHKFTALSDTYAQNWLRGLSRILCCDRQVPGIMLI